MALESGKHGPDRYDVFRKYVGSTYVVYLLCLAGVLGCLVLFYSVIVETYLDECRRAMPLLVLFFALGLALTAVLAPLVAWAPSVPGAQTWLWWAVTTLALVGRGVVFLLACYGMFLLCFRSMGVQAELRALASQASTSLSQRARSIWPSPETAP